MNTAESIVNTYAWMNATRNSKQFMKRIITKLSKVKPLPRNAFNCHPMKMIAVNERMIA